MHCVREIVLRIGNRIFGIAHIVALIARTWHPDNTLEASGTNLIYHRLEEIMESLV